MRDHADRSCSTNWRSYGLQQSRGGMPQGPVTLMVHIASVWVPFTSESKEAIASYPEIQKELRLGLQAVGRKLGMYVRKRLRVKQQGDRREIFLRYLGEVAGAVSEINGVDRDGLYDAAAVRSPRSVTADADMKLDDRGRKIDRRARGARLRRERADRRPDRRTRRRSTGRRSLLRKRNSLTQRREAQKKIARRYE